MNPTTPRAMDASEIARLRELCSKATPGAWMRIMCGCHEMGYDLDGVPVGTRGSFGRAEDADFVAAARSALPAALDALESANAEIKRLRKVVDAFEDLAAAYRLGRRPKEKSLDIIGAYHDAEAAKGEGR